MVTVAARRKVVTWAQEAAGLSQRRACRFFGIARSTVQYRSVRSPDTEMRSRLRELAEERRRWGYRMLHVLLEREGHAVNHKRVYRLYREEGLQIRQRRRRKRAVRPRRGAGDADRTEPALEHGLRARRAGHRPAAALPDRGG